MNPRQFNCEEQVRKLKKRPNSEQAIRTFKLRNSCDSVSETVKQEVNSLRFYNCYCNHLDYSFNHLIEIHSKYEQGILYYPGSLSEQPNKLIDIFNLISQLKEEEKIKQAKQNKGK